MRWRMIAAVVCVLLPGAVLAQKSRVLPKHITNAQFVFVETIDGPIEDTLLDSRVSREDHRAVASVQSALKSWGKYKLTMRRSDADIVLVIRTGQMARANGGVTVKTGRQDPTIPTGTGIGPIFGADGGTPDDTLFVHLRNPDGSLGAPLWRETMDKGLLPPKLPLFQKFKDDVERSLRSQ